MQDQVQAEGTGSRSSRNDECSRGDAGPREGARELDIDLNDNPNLAIFRQSDNGVLVRMALFALILDVADQVDQHSAPVNWYTERRF